MSSDLDRRLSRLDGLITAAEALAPLAHPSVQDGFFGAIEARLVETMIAADPIDDESRRGAALYLKALRDLKQYIANTIRAGERAPQEVEKLRSRQHGD